MAQKTKQWGAIIVMIALFAMIAFVTNLCSPMAVIVKNDFAVSNVLAQIGNYGNFIAYLIISIPAGIDSENGMPVGIQLLGSFLDESRLLKTAASLEAVL